MRASVPILTITLLLLCIPQSLFALEHASESIEALTGDHAVARYTAEEELVKMGRAAIPILESLVTSSGRTPGRQYAIQLLAQIGDEEAIQLLLRNQN